MQNASPNRRTSTKDFLLDLLDFVEEQIEQAKFHPEDQYTAVDAARGVIPLMRDRLEEKENEHLNATFMLLFDNQLARRTSQIWWEEFAKCAHDKFLLTANELLKEGGVLRALKLRLAKV